jgi:hypothetical protein
MQGIRFGNDACEGRSLSLAPQVCRGIFAGTVRTVLAYYRMVPDEAAAFNDDVTEGAERLTGSIKETANTIIYFAGSTCNAVPCSTIVR